MILRRFAVLPFFLVVILSVYAQQSSITPTIDSQAISILQQSVSTMAATMPSDSVASGNIQIQAGGASSTGSVRILTKGTAESLWQLTLPNSSKTIIFSNGQASASDGSTTQVVQLELAATSQVAEFPLPLIASILNNPDTSSQYIGLETSGPTSLQHVRVWDSFASSPNLAALSTFSSKDIWIDASSGLVQRISFTVRAAQGASPGVAMDIYYSGYQVASGVAYPYNIQESLNGTPWATITIQTVSFNNGLTDSQFTVQ
jgi:outer membrane lipoprotein-sorting protein